MYKYILFLIFSIATYQVHMAQSLDAFIDKELNPIEIGKNTTSFTFIEHTTESKNTKTGYDVYIFKKDGELTQYTVMREGHCRHDRRVLVKGSWEKLNDSSINIYMKTQVNNSFHVYEAVYNYKTENSKLILKRMELISNKTVKK